MLSFFPLSGVIDFALPTSTMISMPFAAIPTSVIPNGRSGKKLNQKIFSGGLHST